MKQTNKETIMEAALALFAQQGYGHTPVSQIAKKAGVSQGLLYNYFPGKEALLAALMEQVMAGVAESMAAYGQGLPPADALADHIWQTVRLVQKNPELWKLLHIIRHQHHVMEAIASQAGPGEQFVLDTLGENFRKMGYAAPAEEARILFAAVDGMVSHYLLAPETYPLASVAQCLLGKYGIRHDGQPSFNP